MATLILSKSFGRLGITCENHPTRPGAIVSGLVDDSAAAAAGLHIGDLIVAVNHLPVSNHRECIHRIDEGADVVQLRLQCPTRTVLIDKSHGRVGITCQNSACGVGVEVLALVEGSLAAEAGVSVGDTVLAVNGVLVKSHEDAIFLIDESDVVELVLPDDTSVVEIAKAGSSRKLGITVCNNPMGNGVVVVGLTRGGLAAEALRLGEVVLAVDGNLVPDHATAISLMDGNPGVLRLLAGPPMPEAELDHLIQRATSFGRSAGADLCQVQVSVASPQPLLERANNCVR